MKPYYADDAVTLHHGDSLEVLRSLPSESVNCVVTSPPYYGLRDYGVPGQYGLEETPPAYVEQMRQVFAEVRRVLAGDGTLWLNLGDSYTRGNGQGNAGPSSGLQGGTRPSFRQDGAAVAPKMRSGGLPNKNLLGIPWRVAFALQDDGWILRNRIVWNKSNAMPESVTDRLSNRCEDLFLFTKSQRYWFDLDAIRIPSTPQPGLAGTFKRPKPSTPLVPGQNATQHRADRADEAAYSEGGRNPGDVWTIPTQPFTEAHFAVMPQEVARRCVLAGCRNGGTVLDPFAGSCTTGMVANELGRRFVGIDLSSSYLDLALRTRLAQGVLLLDGAA